MRVLLLQPDTKIEQTCWIAHQLKLGGAERVDIIRKEPGMTPVIHRWSGADGWSEIGQFAILDHPIVAVVNGYDLIVNLESRLSGVLWKYFEKQVKRPLMFGVGPSNTTFTNRVDGIQLLRNSGLDMVPCVTFNNVQDLFQKLIRIEPCINAHTPYFAKAIYVYGAYKIEDKENSPLGKHVALPEPTGAPNLSYAKVISSMLESLDPSVYKDGGFFYRGFPPSVYAPVTAAFTCNGGAKPVNSKTVKDLDAVAKGIIGDPQNISGYEMTTFKIEDIGDTYREALSLIVSGLQLNGSLFFDVTSFGPGMKTITCHTLQHPAYWFVLLQKIASTGQNILHYFLSAAKGVTFNVGCVAHSPHVLQFPARELVGLLGSPELVDVRNCHSSLFPGEGEILWAADQSTATVVPSNTFPITQYNSYCARDRNIQPYFLNPEQFAKLSGNQPEENNEGDTEQCQSVDCPMEPLDSTNGPEIELDQEQLLPEQQPSWEVPSSEELLSSDSKPSIQVEDQLPLLPTSFPQEDLPEPETSLTPAQ